jgi:predicted DNA-binding protein (UPF0251 family)/predicted Fe-Mo cluster-binding NifX family protein
MPGPRRFRRVGFRPNATYFKPAGIRMTELKETILTFDEFEAVRLKDLLGLDQIEAAKKMNVSQPTFHRLILSSRKKIADAIVNSKAIKIEGGKVEMIQEGKEVIDIKVGVGVKEKVLNSQVDEVFGRCPFFIIADIKNKKVVANEFVENISANKAGGAGISAARTVVEKGVKAVITGNIGPRALEVFRQFNIEVYKGRGPMNEVIEEFIQGKLEKWE